MITPTHAVYNLALLGRRGRPERTWPVVLGSFFPDLPAVLCLAVGLTRGDSLAFIHESLYPSPFWRGLSDAFHSIPLALLFGALCLLLKWTPGAWAAAGAFFHSLEDLPVHALTPHRHFWPLWDWRFNSPFSCYDPGYHLGPTAAVDFALLALAAWVLWRRGLTARGKWLVGAALLLEAGNSAWKLAVG